MSVSIYSEGHPHIPAGSAETLEDALLSFINNADDMGVGVRNIFNLTLGEEIGAYLKKNSGRKAFTVLSESGNYGPLRLTPKGSYKYWSPSVGFVTVGFDNVQKGMGRKILPSRD